MSIITAFAPSSDQRLAEMHRVFATAASRWEWLIQVDGPDAAAIPAAVAGDPRVRIETNHRGLGIATTRNRAASRAGAPVLLNADADDLPEPGAIDALLPAFADPAVGLAFGDWIEAWPDRDPWTPIPRFAPGRLAPGTLSAIWASENWVPIHLAGAMWRTDAVLGAGGWTATVAGSDIGLLIGVDAVWASVYVPVTTFTYIHHAAQATADRGFQAQFDVDRRFLQRRYRALRAPRGRTQP